MLRFNKPDRTVTTVGFVEMFGSPKLRPPFISGGKNPGRASLTI